MGGGGSVVLFSLCPYQEHDAVQYQEQNAVHIFPMVKELAIHVY